MEHNWSEHPSADPDHSYSPEQRLIAASIQTVLTDLSLFRDNPSNRYYYENYLKAREFVFNDDEETPFTLVWGLNRLCHLYQPQAYVEALRRIFKEELIPADLAA